MTATLGSLLQTGLALRPDGVALEGAGFAYTFREMEGAANRLAAALRARFGVERGSRVLVLAEKAPEIVVLALAVWKAGGIYVPVDTRSPNIRIGGILASTEPALVVSSRDRLADAKPMLEHMPSLSYEEIAELSPTIGAGELPEVAQPTDTAIIIHTSGSTGVPKGAQLSHRSVLTYFRNHNAFLRFDGASRGMNNGPFHFDVAIQDTFLPLYFGAAVLMHADLFHSAIMIRLILRHRLTHLIAVSSILELISRDRARFEELRDSDLGVVVTGGEICDPKLINRWLDTVPNLRVLYGYGPTECNSLCLTNEITAPDRDRSAPYPIGKPFTGLKALLLDESGETQVAPGAIGTIAIAGPQLMSGYWRDEEQTRKAFRTIGGERYYLTGDLCVLDDNDDFHFVGRRDRQVKLRGRRINLEEVRNALLAHAEVRHSVVGTAEDESELRIVAVIQVAGAARDIDRQIEEVLRDRLPDYMIPSHVGIIEELPRTSTGKIDERRTIQMLMSRLRSRPPEGRILRLLPEEAAHD